MAKTAQAAEILVIHPDESRVYEFEFASDLETGEALSGSPTVEELDSSDLTIGSASISGTKVLARITASGATENTLYYVKCICPTDQSNTLACVGRLKVSREEGDTPAP